LDRNAVIQSWRGQAALADAARKGHDGLLSFGYYLDHMRTAAVHYANDPLGGEAKSLSADEAKHILGGEACMWTEYSNAETTDSRTWPRLAAIAERFWSPATDEQSMYARLEPVSRKLAWTGIEHLSAQPMLLSRMSGDYRLPALRTLIEAVEALGIGGRYKAREYSSLVPLNRLVDAASAESEAVRHLTADAHAVAVGRNANPEASRRLREAFRNWHDLPVQMAALPAPSFLVSEVAPVADQVAKMGDVGLQCMNYLDSGQTAPAAFVSEQTGILDAAAKPLDEVNIASERVVRVLLDAVSGK
jgi:hexosaminidase